MMFHFTFLVSKRSVQDSVRDKLVPSNVSFIGRLSVYSRSQWPRGLGRRTEADRLLRMWVRILPGAWMSVVIVVVVR